MAESKSASSRMMLADLPPSSSVTFLMVFEAICMICEPTSVEPVNAILSTFGCVHRASPIVPPGPLMMLITPLGMRDSAMMRASSSADSGVSLAGFSTTVLPMSAAMVTFHMAIVNGKFQGTMPTHTPIGSRRA
jgi:hypothetical protein